MKLRGEYQIETDEDRVKIIADLVEESSQDPVIRKLSLDILRKEGVREKDSLGEVKAIFNWVKKNIQYRGDVFCRDSYHTAKRTIELQSGDCFPLTQKVIVKNKETGEYELPELGDLKDCYSKYEALSYNFLNKIWEFKNILNWVNKGEKQVVEVRLNNGSVFEATPEHKVFTVEGQKEKDFKILEKELSKIDLTRSWKRRLLVANKIPALNKDYDSKKLWLYGMYAAEGYCSKEGWKVQIANDDKYVKMETAGRLNNLNIPFSISKREKHAFVTILKSQFKEELKNLGSTSIQKKFPDFILSLKENNIEILLDGYAIGDAYIPRPNTSWSGKVRRIYNTISDKLAQQLIFLHLIIGRPLYSQYQINHMGEGKNPIWRLYDRIYTGRFKSNKELINGLKYVCISYIVPSISKEVCDITVEDNHNFVLDNGLLVHNCDDMTILTDAMLASVGFPIGARIITTNPERGFHHIYSLVGVKTREGTKWIPLDAVNKSNNVGDEPRWAKKRDFLFVCGE